MAGQSRDQPNSTAVYMLERKGAADNIRLQITKTFSNHRTLCSYQIISSVSPSLLLTQSIPGMWQKKAMVRKIFSLAGIFDCAPSMKDSGKRQWSEQIGVSALLGRRLF